MTFSLIYQVDFVIFSQKLDYVFVTFSQEKTEVWSCAQENVVPPNFANEGCKVSGGLSCLEGPVVGEGALKGTFEGLLSKA